MGKKKKTIKVLKSVKSDLLMDNFGKKNIDNLRNSKTFTEDKHFTMIESSNGCSDVTPNLNNLSKTTKVLLKLNNGEQLDPIDKIIRLIRSAKTEEEVRKLFEEYFDYLLTSEQVQAWLAEDRREGPIDDYYLSKHDEMLDEASKVLIKEFEKSLKNN